MSYEAVILGGVGIVGSVPAMPICRSIFTVQAGDSAGLELSLIHIFTCTSSHLGGSCMVSSFAKVKVLLYSMMTRSGLYLSLIHI